MGLPLAVSVGCPSGIGPEVTVKVAGRVREPLVLVGDGAQLRALAKRFGVSLDGHTIIEVGGRLAAADRRPGEPTPAGGAAQLAWVDRATDLVREGHARGLVTAPVSKAAIASSGVPGADSFRGHTEHLQRRLRSREVVMAFWSPSIVSALVTTHLPLARVPAAVRPEGVARAAFWLCWLLGRLTPGTAPRVVVASLNPHAGEHGLLGHDEARAITPGIALAEGRCAAAGMRVRFDGPIGAESAYRKAVAGDYDGVVAMYHDQATIPHKLTGFGEAVNVSLGLPIVRTSVDHGTGYDVAGKGVADERGLASAVELAARLTSATGRDTAVRERALGPKGAQRKKP